MAIELVLEEVTNEELPSVAMDTLRTVGHLFLYFLVCFCKDLSCFSVVIGTRQSCHTGFHV